MQIELTPFRTEKHRYHSGSGPRVDKTWHLIAVGEGMFVALNILHSFYAKHSSKAQFFTPDDPGAIFYA